MDSVSHRMNIPIVSFYHLIKNLATSRLLRNDGRCSTLHSFQRSDTERFRDRRHDKYITVLINLIYLSAFHEAREVESIGNTTFSNQVNHGIQHIA